MKAPVWSKDFCDIIDYLFEEYYDEEEDE